MRRRPNKSNFIMDVRGSREAKKKKKRERKDKMEGGIEKHTMSCGQDTERETYTLLQGF